jgi:hypothetical protein
MDELIRQRGEMMAFYREGIIDRRTLRRQIAAIATQIERAATPAPAPAPAPAPTIRSQRSKHARKRARQKLKQAPAEATPVVVTPPPLPKTLPPEENTPPPLPTTPPPLPTTAPPQAEEKEQQPAEHVFVIAEVARGNTAWDWATAPITDEERGSSAVFLTNVTRASIRRLGQDILDHGAVKAAITLEVEYEKLEGFNNDTGEPKMGSMSIFHQAKNGVVLTVADTPEFIEAQFLKIQTDSEEYEAHNGSGWTLRRVLRLVIAGNPYKPIRGASWVKTPPLIAKKKACVNVKNTLPGNSRALDNKCFLWSVLAALHPADSHADRITNYRRHEGELDMTGIDFPVMATKRVFQRFERQNRISLSVFGYGGGVIMPRYVDGLNVQDPHARKVDLLLLSNGGDENHGHYILIRNLSRLISSELATGNGAVEVCRRCLYSTRSADHMVTHERDCRGVSGGDAQPVRMPKGEEAKIRFMAIEKQMPAPFAVYADFEAMNVRVAPQRDDKGGLKNTQALTEHVGCSAGYIVTERRDGKVTVYARGNHEGADPAGWLIGQLQKHLKDIRMKIRQGQQPPRLTDAEETAFREACDHGCCHICKGAFSPSVSARMAVRDHDHLTGKYRGAAHSSCNLQWRLDPKTYKLPVFFHNLRGYDSHLLVKAFADQEESAGRISIVPQNFEKYMAMNLGGLAFKDSCQFMAGGLDKLVKDLKGATPLTKGELGKAGLSEEARKLLTQKGVFPYSWFDSHERMKETALPARENFTSDLTGETVSEEDYERAQAVWKTANCRTFKDYHDIYLQTDVALLADVFEAFRSLMLENYELDPAHYMTAPGMSWDALLKHTGIELELLTDLDMHLFVEKGIRGGICQASHRAAVANNPRVEATGGPKFDSNDPTTWILYLDMNNLYGGAMVQRLPTGGFAWREVAELATELARLKARTDDDARGAYYEVDLEYPREIHDLHNDYPLAPELGTVTSKQLSPWAAAIVGDKKYESRKLLLHFNTREHYVVDYRALQAYQAQGLVVSKVHRVLEFDQSAWMKPYIEKNTEFRRHAKTDFEKEFYKLLNNSVFGKTMEDVRKRTDIQLVRPGIEAERLRRMVAKPTFSGRKIFGENLVAVQRRKNCVLLNKPVYVGLGVLDLSKRIMSDYWYGHIKPTYGDRARLLYTDTDSFIMKIQTPDVYADMAANAALYDFSNVKADVSEELHAIAGAHPEREKTVGLMKDEFGGRVVHSYVGLKPKCYSIKAEGGKVTQKSKGVQRHVTENVLTHDDYWGVVDGGAAISHANTAIRSFGHVNKTVRGQKTSLSALDTKRWVLDDGISSRAYGHWRNSAHDAPYQLTDADLEELLGL